jgi:hypothetical protein
MHDPMDIAAGVLQQCVPGAVVTLHDTGGNAQYDYQVELPAGEEIAVEVTRAADPTHISTSYEVLSVNKGGQFIRADRCSKDWYVIPIVGARIGLIRQEVDAYLASIEQAGIERFFAYTDAAESAEVRSILEDLGVEAGWVASWKTSPQICIALPGLGPEIVDSTSAINAALVEANKPDNQRKLSASGCAQRHLFVFMDHSFFGGWMAMNDHLPPEVPVSLPAAITHLWIAASTRTSGEYVVWKAVAGDVPELLERVMI